EALWYPEVAMIDGIEHDRSPAPERRRAGADVDGDVVDLAVEHADQLALRIRPLVMQAAQHTVRRARYIALHDREVQPGIFIFFRMEAFVEKAARIAVHGRFDHHAAG